MILVTGATGFVGNQLVKVLIAQQKKVRCFVRRNTPDIKGMDQNIEIIEGDIRDKEAVKIALKGVHQVVHLATMVNNTDLDIIRQINVEGTKNLVSSSVEYDIEQFIFLSTLNVTLPVKNQYSKTKLDAEDIIKKSGLNYTILRPSIIYGRDDRGTISKFAQVIKTNKKIFLLGNGEYKLQPIYIDDVIKAISIILNNSIRFQNKTFYVVGNDVVSYNKIVIMISSLYGVKIYKIYLPLFIIYPTVKILSKLSKKYVEFEEKLKTFPYDKIVYGSSQNDVFPLPTTPLIDGLAECIKLYLDKKN